MGYDSLSNGLTDSHVQKRHPESVSKSDKSSIHQESHASRKNFEKESMPGAEAAKKLIEINTHLLSSSLSVKQNGDIIGNRTKKKYGNIDIASFRKLPIESKFVYTTYDEDSQTIHTDWKEGKNTYFSDKNGSYVYLGQSNIIYHLKGSNSLLEKVKVPELTEINDQYRNNANYDYFISNGNFYNGYGEEIYKFPDGKKWDRSVKIHGDFSLIEIPDGSLYTKDNGDGLEKLPYNISDIIIQKKSWETLEDPKNGVDISIKVKKTGKIIRLNPYF